MIQIYIHFELSPYFVLNFLVQLFYVSSIIVFIQNNLMAFMNLSAGPVLPLKGLCLSDHLKKGIFPQNTKTFLRTLTQVCGIHRKKH